MCVKLSFEDLNSGPCPPHLTSTYTCRVTIVPRVCDSCSLNFRIIVVMMELLF